MAIASITIWLNSTEKNYTHGKMLYEQYGQENHLKALFNSGESTYHFQKLLEALEDLNKLNSPPPKKIIIAEREKPSIVKKIEKTGFENAPEKIIEIKTEKNKAFALARKLFEMIPYMDSQEHRREAGKELLEKMKFVQTCWQAIDEWKANGNIINVKLKEIEVDVNSLTLADLLKEEKNLPPNISKDKKKLLIEENPSRKLKLERRIIERTKRLEHIKRRLNELI